MTSKHHDLVDDGYKWLTAVEEELPVLETSERAIERRDDELDTLLQVRARFMKHETLDAEALKVEAQRHADLFATMLGKDKSYYSLYKALRAAAQGSSNSINIMKIAQGRAGLAPLLVPWLSSWTGYEGFFDSPDFVQIFAPRYHYIPQPDCHYSDSISVSVGAAPDMWLRVPGLMNVGHAAPTPSPRIAQYTTHLTNVFALNDQGSAVPEVVGLRPADVLVDEPLPVYTGDDDRVHAFRLAAYDVLETLYTNTHSPVTGYSAWCMLPYAVPPFSIARRGCAYLCVCVL